MPGIGYSGSSSNNKTIGWSTGGGNIAARVFPTFGRGMPGMMAQPLIVHDNSDDFARMRQTLREVWNTELYTKKTARIITPFRAINNAGDTLSRSNYSCGGTCQSFQSRPGMHGLKSHFGAIQATCIPDAYYSAKQLNPKVPASACNVKYVYDGSDYTTYLKQQAVNKNYNDRSFGGNDYSGAQSAIRAIRRY